MSDYYYLNPDHSYEPCDVTTWSEQFEYEDKTVQRDIVGKYFISTIWLGLNHNFGNGVPLLFETIIFEKESKYLGDDVYMKRYSTWSEALEGHLKAIEMVKNLPEGFSGYIHEQE